MKIINNIGIYIHIPFCESKCPYCDFFSVTPTEKSEAWENTKELYYHAILENIRAADNIPADTIYFGGGTPVLIGVGRISGIIAALFEKFNLKSNQGSQIEITVEANPNTVNLEILDALRQAGVNRISFGMQSGVDKELFALGRRHSVAQAVDAADMARKAGFDNISLDLMLGIPFQTYQSLSSSLDIIERINPKHLSAYILKIEKNTAFFGKGNIIDSLPNEDSVCEMYLYVVERLERMGLLQYEVSNFAIPGFECRHNLKYWRSCEYLGFGASAHSYFNNKRFYNISDIRKYIDNPCSNIYYTDDNAGGFEEYAMLKLRLCEGLDIIEARDKFGVEAEYLIEKASEFEKSDLVHIKNSIISLTARGFLISNKIIGHLLF